MRLKSDIEILDPKVRKRIIEEIEGSENKRRKNEAFRRWQVYKDKTSTFVIDLLLEQFSEETVREMTYSITNVSLVRKIINKLARVYQNGASRSVAENDTMSETINELEDYFGFDQKMKTQNKIVKLQKNSCMYVKPCPYIGEDGEEYVRLRLSPMNPYLYDVVEEFYDRTKPLAYVFNNYDYNSLLYTSLDPARVRTQSGHLRAGFSSHTSPYSSQGYSFGDNKDQTIADKKIDEDEAPENEKPYIWWTDKFHFTTIGSQIVDASGMPIDVVSEDDERIQNPIGCMPVVNFAIEQDNSFWAEGGEDLIDAGIVVNSMLSQINHIGVVQGYGQFFMSGKNLPRNITTGPNKAIILEYEEGEPEPSLGFATANPPLADLMKNAESLVALALTTNDLSTSGVKTELSSASAASGIALMIDRAESQESVKDQRQLFVDGERQIWSIIQKWMQYYAEENKLDPQLQELLLPEDVDLAIEFVEPEILVTEAEKLANLKLRKELGISTMLELIQLDQPALDDAQAQAKLDEIMAEKQLRMDTMMPDMEGEDEFEDQENDSQENPDNE